MKSIFKMIGCASHPFRRKAKAEPVRYESVYHAEGGWWDVIRIGDGPIYEREICTCFRDGPGLSPAANARLIADALNKQGR